MIEELSDEASSDFSGQTLKSNKERNNSFVFFKERIKKLTNTILICGIILLIIALYVPWGKGRHLAYYWYHKLLKQQILSYIDIFGTSIETIFSKYERQSQYLGLTALNQSFMRCDEFGMLFFVKFAQYTHRYYDPPPASLFLGQNSTFCEIVFPTNGSKKYDLYYGMTMENGTTELRLYNESVDLENWDPLNTGRFIENLNVHDRVANISSDNNDTFWTNYYMVSDGYQINKYLMSAITPIRDVDNGNEILYLSGVSLEITKLVEELDDVDNFVEGKYCFLDSHRGVVIDSVQGSVQPKKIGSMQVPIYPKLNEVEDPFWNNLSPIINNSTSGSVIDFEYNETMYMVTVRNLKKANKNSQLFVLAIDVDNYISDSYLKTTEIFLICMSALYVLFLIIKILVNKNNLKKETKLKRQKITVQNDTYQMGTLGNVIGKLRQLQLSFPEDVMLNKMLDNTVSQLTQTQGKRFAVYSHSNCTCDFCVNIVVPEPIMIDYSNSHIIPFEIWKKLNSSRINKGQEIKFNWNSFEKDPYCEVVLIMIQIIVKEEFFFSQFDPDSLSKFFFEISTKFMKNPVFVGPFLVFMHRILSGPYNNWIPCKLDLFCLYFTGFIKDIISNIQLSDLVHILPKDEIYYEAEKYLNVFCDEYSIFELKMKVIFSILHKYIPECSIPDPTTIYFEKLITDLCYSTEKSDQFEQYGEYWIRVNSPDFSVHTECNDRLIFMKAILKFCDLNFYMMPHQDMLRSVPSLNKALFTQIELEDMNFIATFHYQISISLVTPWISLFSHFAPLDDLVDNLSQNISFWKLRIRSNDVVSDIDT